MEDNNHLEELQKILLHSDDEKRNESLAIFLKKNPNSILKLQKQSIPFFPLIEIFTNPQIKNTNLKPIIQLLIEHGSDLNEFLPDHSTALYHLVKNIENKANYSNNLEYFSMLLEAGANFFDKENTNGDSVDKIIERLGKDYKELIKKYEDQKQKNTDLEQFMQLLIDYASNLNREKEKIIIKTLNEKPFLMTMKNNQGKPLLYVILENKHTMFPKERIVYLKLVNLILDVIMEIESGFPSKLDTDRIYNIRTNLKQTPLMAAVTTYASVVSLFFTKYKHAKFLINALDYEGATALDYLDFSEKSGFTFTDNDYHTVVRLILLQNQAINNLENERLKIKFIGKESELKELNKLLHQIFDNVTDENTFSNIDKLLKENTIFINETIPKRGLPIIAECMYNHPNKENVISLLKILKENNVDPTNTQYKNSLPISLAINFLNEEIIKSLLILYQIKDLVKNKSEITELYTSSFTSYKLVLDTHESENKQDLINKSKTIINLVFMSILENVIRSDDDDNYELLPEDINPNIVFLDQQSEIFGKNFTVLMWVAFGKFLGRDIKNRVRIMNYLIENGANVNATFIDPTFDEITSSVLNFALDEDNFNDETYDIIKILLVNGARVENDYKLLDSGQLVNRQILGVSNSPKINKKTIDILHQSELVEMILTTPYMLSIDEEDSEDLADHYRIRNKLLETIYKFNPEYFSLYPKIEDERLEPQIINPDDKVMDLFTLEEEPIKEFLQSDRENNFVLRDYNNSSATFLLSIETLKKVIEADFTKKNTEDTEDTSESSGVIFGCNKVNDSYRISKNDINNIEPYLDGRSIAISDCAIPLLEIYEKIIMPPVEQRGQYFSFKLFEKKLDPIANIAVINHNPYVPGYNRFGEPIQVVGATYCKEGQNKNIATVIKALPLKN